MAAASSSPVTAAVILIGNEILSGRTQDANLGYLAQHLNETGVRVMEARVVADIEADIIEAVNACRGRHHYVFTTGGIGPTHDDITAAAIAKAFDLPLTLDAEAVRRLESHYPAGKLNAARKRMAMVPAGAALIDNPISAAPGFRIGNVFVLAGVPLIMRAMFDSIAHSLSGGVPMRSRTFRTNLAEGTMAADLAALQARYADVEIGSYPSFGRPGETGVRIVLRGTDANRLQAAGGEFAAMASRLGGVAEEVEIVGG
jgi:molybdenum cofactor synthesis domain-containing protein